MVRAPIRFPTTGPLKGMWRIVFKNELGVLERVEVKSKGKWLKNVPVWGDFEIQKFKAGQGQWERVELWHVPQNGNTRIRLDFSCCELSRDRRIPVHQALYFLCSRQYKFSREGWLKFKAENEEQRMTVDHLDAWWQVERCGLQHISQTENSSKTKCKEKPGTKFPWRGKE